MKCPFFFFLFFNIIYMEIQNCPGRQLKMEAVESTKTITLLENFDWDFKIHINLI